MHMKLRIIIIIGIVAISTGCSINHHVAEDYGTYLSENKNEEGLPKTDLNAAYDYSHNTKKHRYEFRAVSVGYANLWIVEFAKILDETMSSEEIQSAFGGISKAGSNSESNTLIEFSLVDYTYANYAATIVLNVKMSKEGTEVINKTYRSSGEGQATQMVLGGVFGMMEAIHDSTKSSLDSILSKFINDINALDVTATSNLTN